MSVLALYICYVLSVVERITLSKVTCSENPGQVHAHLTIVKIDNTSDMVIGLLHDMVRTPVERFVDRVVNMPYLFRLLLF